MELDSFVPVKDQTERQNPFFEIISVEKQLWALVQSKGLLQTEVQDLYHQARLGYEKFILANLEELEHKDVEYSLWKLHYKHIDEFRKKTRQTSANTESIKTATPQDVANMPCSIDAHAGRFKSFLSEASEFYQDLIAKVRRRYRLPEDPSFYDQGGVSCTVDPTKLDRCQYLCHRLLVCLGDLARYRDLCKKLDFERHDWSVAANYYFKAALVWPDSGNPQNQLALLATYVGDDFLALYHCIRSLAIKEPFPDARDNLILLFEKNRSSHLHSLSKDIHFEFLNPSERSATVTESESSGRSLNNDTLRPTDHVSSAEYDLWPLFVRMASFYFIESSLEEFPCVFASTVRELDSLLTREDNQLKCALESYQHMDSARAGPYRALQMVSVLIFIMDNLTGSLNHRESKERNNVQQPILIKSALTATFICLGRLIKRCVKVDRNSIELSPLLPAVLVFVEWLVRTLDELDTYGSCEKVGSAVSYFVCAFVDLLNQLDMNDDEFKYQENTALWEDYELKGFAPLAHAHGSLNFINNPKLMGNYDCRNSCRAHRIFRAAMKVVDGSGRSQKLIFYDNLVKKFYTTESEKLADRRAAEVAESSSDPEVKELQEHREAEVGESSSDLGVEEFQRQKYGAAKESVKDMIGQSEIQPFGNGKFVSTDEEEVILFKPLTRYNSAPLHIPAIDEEMSMEVIKKGQTAPSDECLRRATSVFAIQNPTKTDPLSFHLDGSNFSSNKPFKPQEPLLKDSATFRAGPPSLSAWVLDRESSNIEKDNGTKGSYKPSLSPIDETAPASLAGLSISVTEDSLIDAEYVSPPRYLAPVPSAPLLPDDAVWFTGNPPVFSNVKSSGSCMKEADGILGAPPLSSYANCSATHGPLSFGYQPVHGMSSSEWLHQYSNQNLDPASSQAWPAHFYAPGRLGSFYGHDGSRFDLCDRWGNPLSPNPMVYLESPRLYPGAPLVYGADEERREKFFHNFQRPSPYGCGAGTELIADQQPPLLQYLKEKEWQLQQQYQVRGPAWN